MGPNESCAKMKAHSSECLHKHQRKNLPRRTLNSEHLCSKCKDTHIHKRNFTKLKAHITPHTIIVENFNTPLSSMEILGKHKINRYTVKLTEVMDQMNVTNIDRTFYPKSKEYSFFSAPHGTSTKLTT